MLITPRTEQELFEELIVPAGTYDFEIVFAEDAVSKKSGKEMIKLRLKVWDQNGKIRFVNDFLMEAMAFKLRHFYEYTGMIEKYNVGNIQASDCMNRCGQAEIIVKKADDNFPLRNEVKDYIKTEKSAKMPASTDVPFEDDLDIPF